MTTASSLQNLAIQAAKDQNWAEAAKLNQTILVQNPADLGALNRLGVAYGQLGELSKAKESFKTVLQFDKSNTIAKKHLTKLSNNQELSAPSFTKVHFIEEPGKTKIVELHRLAGKNVLDNLAIGQLCELKTKNRYVSVDANGTYIGALPEDLSFRLCKLLNSGNHYECYVHSFTSNSCQVYIRETLRSVENRDIHSFPPVKSHLAAINDIDEEFLLEEDIPVEIVETDRDMVETERELEEEDKTFEPMELPDNSEEN
ncbi:MAG TPA: tetratricopeptide repeat protein [Vitreimonas sp.]|nr:tetratricopeptide repeat protein [Vitreimonas sp.]